MKKKVLSIVCLGLAALFFSACAITFPDSPFYDYRPYRIILQVEPNVAEVFVNGRFVGLAYEFASERTALRLASRRTEVLLALPGYEDEFVDLRAYSTRTVTVRLAMVSKTEAVPAGKLAGDDPAYQFSEVEAVELPEETELSLDLENYTEVVLQINVEDAAVYVNGAFWGITPPGGRIENARLALGKNLFEVFKPGYQPYRKEFTVSLPKTEGQAQLIEIELKK